MLYLCQYLDPSTGRRAWDEIRAESPAAARERLLRRHPGAELSGLRAAVVAELLVRVARGGEECEALAEVYRGADGEIVARSTETVHATIRARRWDAAREAADLDEEEGEALVWEGDLLTLEPADLAEAERAVDALRAALREEESALLREIAGAADLAVQPRGDHPSDGPAEGEDKRPQHQPEHGRAADEDRQRHLAFPERLAKGPQISAHGKPAEPGGIQEKQPEQGQHPLEHEPERDETNDDGGKGGGAHIWAGRLAYAGR